MDPRVHELQRLLPQCLLADWVRIGSRLIRLLRDTRHEAAHDAVLTRLLQQARTSAETRERRGRHVPSVHYPQNLPISARKDEIVAAIRAHPVVVIAGETGSGKTTQLPKMCLEAGLGIEGKIGCTQPRRVAAVSISRRLAEELDVTWGREVGCKIRFDDRSSTETYIKFMTDGILLAETQGDPMLAEYNGIIIDEAHERSLNIDFLLGHLKGLLAKRNDLKLIITSATIDTETFSRAFNNAPIIEVSGRTFPVEVMYRPLDAASEDRGETTFVDAAVHAAVELVQESAAGDLLIFMPGERDIREAGDLLENRCGGQAEVIPLFGRLSAGDQQRVFAPSMRRKIVVATNIAETSLTIPGIRYVIDTGLARLSRYNARTRTKRLPVEPISQSSANQRKGRAGRLEDGLCIRLYSETDFAERPAYTQPEIQRANLAEVILRMIAFGLGEIETFPFVNPPAPAAIEGGYVLLHELGALDEHRQLTRIGHALARLPIDPTLGRMLLQAQQEHATRELLIIAAGLSIQDPRERPLEQKEAAAAAHKRFVEPTSDFLTLLNLWNAYHEQWETLRTQNQRRKFCRTHFLNYLRMREWQELHAQLQDALEELGAVRMNERAASREAIHRSILAGLLGHVACRTERNVYKAPGNRQVMLFPGSALFERNDKPRKAAAHARSSAPPDKSSTAQPGWIVAGEIVETSQLFARTVAGIEPAWLAELGAHVCRVTHQNAHWSPEAGRVLAEERFTLHGLEVQSRRVFYGNINASEATAIFIRAALVEGNLFPNRAEEFERAPHPRATRKHGDSRRAGEALEPEREDRRAGRVALPTAAVGRSRAGGGQASSMPAAYQFLEHNAQVRHKIETWQTRVRHHDLPDLEQALFEFYSARIKNVASRHELERLLREQNDPGFLRVSESDLITGRELHYDAAAFPDSVQVGGQTLELSYAYAPGEEWDGVTVLMPWSLAQVLSSAAVAWSVPGLREAQAAELLRALPKGLRRELMPLAPKAIEIAQHFEPLGSSFHQELALFVRQRYGVAVSASSWPANPLPAHLLPRIELMGADGKTMATGRDLAELRARLAQQPAPAGVQGPSPAWTRAAAQWERFDVSAWNFGDLPERLTVSESSGPPLYAWPGLQTEEGKVSVRLFQSPDGARRASWLGVRRLVELALQKDLAWLAKDLRGLSRFAALGATETLQEDALHNLKEMLLPAEPLAALTAAAFQCAVERARARLPGLSTQLIERVGAILQLRQEVRKRCGASATPPRQAQAPKRLTDLKQLGVAGLTADTAAGPVAGTNSVAGSLEALLPENFLRCISFERLVHVPRYLKALLLRAERAENNPAKDAERVRQLGPYLEAYRKWAESEPFTREGRHALEELRWMLEEFKVSLFAQELGTSVTVSPKRLEEQIARVRQLIT
jgi:ATP-dependent helicase HrpA